MKTLPSRRAWSPALRLGLLIVGLLLVLSAVVLPRQARSDGFIDPAFTSLWTRTDAPVAGRQVVRTWMWGPAAGPAKREPYAEGAAGVRLVQYFDKGRMEINNPAGDPKAPFYVTSGLLTVELVSGQVQVGNSAFQAGSPAQIPLASDRDDANAPTYASFLAVSDVPGASHPAQAALGQPANTRIDRAGTLTPLGADQSDYGVKYAYYEPLTHHNVADVFWRFLNARGPVLVAGKLVDDALFKPWFALTGLPISEAYWAQVKIAGRSTDVLIQAFERRVLTFVPANPEGWQVEMGNIGLHYLEWRYSPAAAPTVAAPPPPGPPPLPAIAITAIVTGKSGLNLNEQTVTIVSGGTNPVNMSAWRLVSPKNDHEDVYIFPQGFVLAGGAQVVVHAGQGYDSPGVLYMRRVTWLFDATGFDGVTLYDGAGRQVASYYLQAGAPPTPPGPLPAPTDTPLPGGKGTPTPESTPPSDVTATPTVILPTPQPTSPSGLPTPTSTPASKSSPTATATATVTATPRSGTQLQP